MKNGFVKIWKEFDGWGFIEDEEGFDYFCFQILICRKIKIY